MMWLPIAFLVLVAVAFVVILVQRVFDDHSDRRANNLLEGKSPLLLGLVHEGNYSVQHSNSHMEYKGYDKDGEPIFDQINDGKSVESHDLYAPFCTNCQSWRVRRINAQYWECRSCGTPLEFDPHVQMSARKPPWNARRFYHNT